MAGFSFRNSLPSDWADSLSDQLELLDRLEAELSAQAAQGERLLPEKSKVLRAFQLPIDQVRVLIVGQDPYPTPGHAVGLSFSVDRSVKPLPKSLQNIYKELEADLQIPPASHGDLSAWSAQGVLLLNRVLTVKSGTPASHQKLGWEQFTEAAIRQLVAQNKNFVAILWGNAAQSLAPLLEGVPIIASVHPSPLSASRGFFGSKPFSRANTELEKRGLKAIDWRVV